MWLFVEIACVGSVSDLAASDAGVDAGTVLSTPDSGVVADAGEPAPVDAGSPRVTADAGGHDAVDAGEPVRDAGVSARDAGQPAPVDAGAPSDPFTFLVYGDSRDGNHACEGNDLHQQLVARMANEPAAMVFHTGDMITGYDDSTTWARSNFNCGSGHAAGTFKELIAPLQNKKPAPGLPAYFFPVIGNHDDAWGDCPSNGGRCWYPDPSGDGVCSVFSKELVRQLVPNHRTASYFQDPTNNSNMPAFASDDDFYTRMCSTAQADADRAYPTYFYYSFNYRNTHFVVLRVNSDPYDLEECGNCGAQSNYDNFYNIHQLHWLRYDLSKARATAGIENVVMFLHAPVFTTSDGHSAVASAGALATEASKYGVKMVFSGHSHVYERSVPIRVDATHAAGVRDDAAGTTYIVTGGGGSAPHGFHDAEWFDAFRADGQWLNAHPGHTSFHYVRVTVTGTQLQTAVIEADGSVIETFAR